MIIGYVIYDLEDLKYVQVYASPIFLTNKNLMYTLHNTYAKPSDKHAIRIGDNHAHKHIIYREVLSLQNHSILLLTFEIALSLLVYYFKIPR